MDILRKELNSIYESQHLENEVLDMNERARCEMLATGYVSIVDGCAVITDASCDRSYLRIGALGMLLGISDAYPVSKIINSSDEDIIYNRLHPEDLVEKRMLEYELFKHVNQLDGSDKLKYQATCKIRVENSLGKYNLVDNTTQVIALSPADKIWLILCTYSLASNQRWQGSISPVIKDNRSGEIITLSLNDGRKHILTDREKEILLLVKEGKASKQIADILGISLHTVNRHRQNIIEKLSVSNSIEAIMAAESMRLL